MSIEFSKGKQKETIFSLFSSIIKWKNLPFIKMNFIFDFKIFRMIILITRFWIRFYK
jgi:hypothetical protein